MLKNSLLYSKAFNIDQSESFSLDEICSFLSKDQSSKLNKKKIESLLNELSSKR